MGLERVAAVLQKKISNFETDLFTPLIFRAAELVPLTDLTELVQNASLRIIADHARAATFLISDGVLPSNEGRGYVLRKILRRAIRHGRIFGQDQPFLFQMVYAVRALMSGAYPELIDSTDRVAKVVRAEETQFDRVLKSGLVEWEKKVAELTNEFDRVRSESDTPHEGTASYLWLDDNMIEVGGAARAIVFPGDEAFHLYETFGLPLDFMVDAAHDAGIAFDHEGFEAARAEEQVPRPRLLERRRSQDRQPSLPRSAQDRLSRLRAVRRSTMPKSSPS